MCLVMSVKPAKSKYSNLDEINNLKREDELIINFTIPKHPLSLKWLRIQFLLLEHGD